MYYIYQLYYVNISLFLKYDYVIICKYLSITIMATNLSFVIVQMNFNYIIINVVI